MSLQRRLRAVKGAGMRSGKFLRLNTNGARALTHWSKNDVILRRLDQVEVIEDVSWSEARQAQDPHPYCSLPFAS